MPYSYQKRELKKGRKKKNMNVGTVLKAQYPRKWIRLLDTLSFLHDFPSSSQVISRFMLAPALRAAATCHGNMPLTRSTTPLILANAARSLYMASTSLRRGSIPFSSACTTFTPIARRPSSSRVPPRLRRYPLAKGPHSHGGSSASTFATGRTRPQDSSVMSMSLASVSPSGGPLAGVGVGGFRRLLPGVETRPVGSGETV